MKYLPGVFFLMLIGIFFKGLFLHPQELPSAMIGKPIPHFQLDTLAGGILDSSELKARYTLLNVWASWCTACAEEQSFLMHLAEQGMVIYGMNYKDNPDHAKKWLARWGDPYHAVGEDPQGTVAMELGIYGTPETFLIDPAGHILHRHPGVLTESIWVNEFEPKMKIKHS